MSITEQDLTENINDLLKQGSSFACEPTEQEDLIEQSDLLMQEDITLLLNHLIELKNEVNSLLNKYCNKTLKKIKQKNTEKVIRKRLNRTSPLNKSKYLNEEQRDILLNYVNEEETLNLIKAQPKSTRISFVQKLIKENFGINLSLYMTGKLISILKI